MNQSISPLLCNLLRVSSVQGSRISTCRSSRNNLGQFLSSRWQTTNTTTPPQVLVTHEPFPPNTNGVISTITLNRPNKANAMGHDMIHELNRILDQLDSMPSSRCVLLTSSSRVFSAGADLQERALMTTIDAVDQWVHLLRMTFDRVARLPMPTISVIEGVAVGGGLELALATDIRVASRTMAKVGLPETSLGIIPGAGGTQRLVRLIGMARAKELIFTGQVLTASMALEYGIFQHVVDDGQAHVKAMELAEAIAQNGPIAIRAAKEAMDGGIEKDMGDALQLERQCYAKVLPTKDRLEGLAAFQQGRRPTYSGN